IYVADGANARIQVFDADGRFVRSVGGPDLFRRVQAIAADPSGNVYVVDHDRLLILKLGPDGEERWRTCGLVGEHAFRAFAVMILDDGRVLVTTDAEERPRVLDPATGAVIGSWGPIDGWTPSEGRVIPGGNVVLYQYEPAERVEAFDSDGHLLGVWNHGSGPNTDRVIPPVWG